MNEELIAESTIDRPAILFNLAGNLSLNGRSLPEDAFSFYQPVLEWLTNYAKSPASETTLTINLEYFNTASAKQIYKIISIISEIGKKCNAVINWHYDEGDRDMLASGERFSKLSGFPFKFEQNSKK